MNKKEKWLLFVDWWQRAMKHVRFLKEKKKKKKKGDARLHASVSTLKPDFFFLKAE